MIKNDLWMFFKFFGSGVIFSFVATIITFFVLAYTKIMDITVMLLLGIVWLLVGILPSFLTAIWVMFRQSNTPNYKQLFIMQFFLGVSFVLVFIVWTGELKGVTIEQLLPVSLVIVGMGVVSGVVATASGFITFRRPKT